MGHKDLTSKNSYTAPVTFSVNVFSELKENLIKGALFSRIISENCCVLEIQSAGRSWGGGGGVSGEKGTLSNNSGVNEEQRNCGDAIRKMFIQAEMEV